MLLNYYLLYKANLLLNKDNLSYRDYKLAILR
jgi:hypothetical protein